jgi:hypothetical protein
LAVHVPAICIPLPCKAQNSRDVRKILQFGKAIDDGTILASGKTIRFWDITPVKKDNPSSFPAQLFLETALAHGSKCLV